MKLLLTAFEPFGGEKVNSALEAIKLVADKLEDCDIVKLTVPTVFYKSIEIVKNAIVRESPDAVLCIGQAGGRKEISLERVAINVMDASIPDNEGNQPVDKAIYLDGKNAYFSTLPIKEIVREIRNAHLPAGVSNSAGTFVCNQLMYGLLYLLEKQFPKVKGGFIHVPLSPAQTVEHTQPSMELSDLTRGIEIAIQTIQFYLKSESGSNDRP